MLDFCQLDPDEHIPRKFDLKVTISKHRLQNGGNFFTASMCKQSKRSQIAQQIYYQRNLFITKSGENEWELRIQPNNPTMF